MLVCLCPVVSDSFVTPRTVAPQAPLFMGYPRQEYSSRLPFLPPRDLPDPGVEPASPVSPSLAGGFFTAEPPGKVVSLQLLTTIFVGPLTCELSQSFRKFI